MQPRSHTTRNLIIAAAVIALVIFAGYMYVKRDRTPNEALLTSAAPGQEGGVAQGDLLSALFELKRLKLDDSIFTNPVWASLSDFSQTLTPESPGRPNPFAPFSTTTTTFITR